jgi:hypothetical protein
MAHQEQLDLLNQGVEQWNQWKTATQEVAPGSRWNLDYPDSFMMVEDDTNTDSSLESPVSHTCAEQPRWCR